jgi:hypothetical protein
MPEIAESSAPDWNAIAHEVLCPLCEYNLRGLSEGRCPECGYRFEWSVITDLAARPHPFLFEHHPERNVRSFFRTLWGTITPTRFSKSRILDSFRVGGDDASVGAQFLSGF